MAIGVPIINATPPPARRNTPTKATEAKVKASLDEESAKRKKTRRDGIMSVFTPLHMGLIATNQTADAGAINRHGPNIAKEIVEYAEGDQVFGAKLDKLSEVSPLAGIFTATVPLLLQVAVNHKIAGMTADRFAGTGVVSPETLQSETRSMLAKMQTQALAEERENMQRLMEERQAYAEVERLYNAKDE